MRGQFCRVLHRAAVFGLASILAFGAIGGPVVAQMLPPGFDEALQPDFTRVSVMQMVQELQLTQEQATIIQGLQADYDTAFKAGVKQIQSRLRENVTETDDQDTPELKRQREALQRQIAELMEEARKLQNSPSEGDSAKVAAQEIKRKTQELNEKIKALQASSMSAAQLQATFEAAAAELELWQTEKKRLGERFASDVKTVLDEPQRLKWPAFERRLVRERTIGRGKLAGESVNLYALVREVDLDDATMVSLAPLLDEYDLKLDAALRARNDFTIGSQRLFMQAAQARSAELAGPVIRREVELRVAVRGVNEQFAPLLAARMPEPIQIDFQNLYRQRGFPMVYRSTPVQRNFKVALELAQDDPTLQEAIRGLETAYLSELHPLNEQLRQAVIAHEGEEFARQSEARIVGKAGQVGEALDGLTDVRGRRHELDRRYQKELLAILPPGLASEVAGVSRPQTEP
jgi:hypothetical protein